jgi:hypothetical protein
MLAGCPAPARSAARIAPTLRRCSDQSRHRSERFADQLPQCLEERCEIVVFVPMGACEGQHLVRRRRGGQRDA